MDPHQEPHQYLTKAKLAGILRQLLSYGVKLPDLSFLESISNSTAAVVFDVARREISVGGKTEVECELFSVRAISQTDVRRGHEIHHHTDFMIHCSPRRAESGRRGPAYEFWLDGLDPGVRVNGKFVKMAGLFVNMMPNSVSLIQTSSRNTEFHLFVQLHEIYWPVIDRNVKWEQHFHQSRRERPPTIYIPGDFTHIDKINKWLYGIEEYLKDTQGHCHPDSEVHVSLVGLETQSTATEQPQARYFAGMPRMESVVEEDPSGPRKISDHPAGQRRQILTNSIAVSNGLNNLERARPVIGHRRSARLKESTLLQCSKMG